MDVYTRKIELNRRVTYVSAAPKDVRTGCLCIVEGFENLNEIKPIRELDCMSS